MEKQALVDTTGAKPERKKYRRLNLAIHSGKGYDTSGLTEPELEDLVVDLTNSDVDGEQFYSKWAYIYSGPVPEEAAVDAPAQKL